MGRQNGFYWVLVMGKWEVAQWLSGSWWACGVASTMDDRTFEQIDERRIERAEEVK